MPPPQPARDRDRPADVTADAATEAAAPAPRGEIHAAGPVPPVAAQAVAAEDQLSASDLAYGTGPAGVVGGPEIEATDQALGQHMVDAMNQVNSGGGLEHGVHYWYNYKRHCENAGTPDRWKDEYRGGHTYAKEFINPHERGRWMDFELKKGHSASAGIKAWLAGATVAECLSAVVAMEIDTLRASIGDKKFDEMFGSDDPAIDNHIPADQRMHVKAGLAGTPVGNYITATTVAKKARGGGEVTEAELENGLVPGQWYYFYNHPKYLLKHPGGAWQGENALYMGKNGAGERMWAGMGASNKTEDTMVEEMVTAYNHPRNDHDKRMLEEGGALASDGTYADPRYDPAGGAFPDTVTRKDILDAPAYELNGRTRKGGFKADSGMALDAERVKRTRDL